MLLLVLDDAGVHDTLVHILLLVQAPHLLIELGLVGFVTNFGNGRLEGFLHILLIFGLLLHQVLDPSLDGFQGALEFLEPVKLRRRGPFDFCH